MDEADIGVVKTFAGNFGFIGCDRFDKDLFFHRTVERGNPQHGDRVSFIVTVRNNKLCAERVAVLPIDGESRA